MHFPRSSGILFHPTSLPGRYGVGDLGLTAYQFVDFLADAGQQFWQILPLNPTGYGNSPYQSPSAFAGNPLLISPDMLVEEGLLDEEEIGNLPGHFQMEDRVNFDAVTAFKNALFQRSFERFQSQKGTQHQKAYEEFCTTNANWLPDYALFMALREQMNFACWNTWERDIALRKPEALEACRKNLADQVAYHTYLQYVFHRQWLKLRAYANENGVRILGDIPIYVAYDSADVWANPHLYKLDQAGNPTVVAGVPPDYFSATGQRWGNPIYRWDQMAKDDFF